MEPVISVTKEVKGDFTIIILTNDTTKETMKLSPGQADGVATDIMMMLADQFDDMLNAHDLDN